MTAPKSEPDDRVLVFAPVGRDAELTRSILAGEGISSCACSDMNELCRECVSGAGAVLLTEEALSEPELELLVSKLDQQPLWSDLPLILFADSKESARFFLETAGPRLNLTILERPINIAIVVSVVRSALRARRRQYQMRDVLTNLEQANQTKDEFLATVSHELRTPLNAMMGWATILRRGGLDATTTAHALEVLERNARSQAQLIEDLLDVSRIITGKLRLDALPLSLAQVIKAAVDVVHPAADARGVRLEVMLDPLAGPVLGDSGRLQQVVWNLLNNAVKFTLDGGRVQIRLQRTNSHVEIVVSDNGQGISQEFLPFVFDRFRQADGSLARKHGGMGLGLAIVRHLVELHGGTVSAFSAGRNKGSIFTVKLPLMTARNIGTVDTASARKQTKARAGIPIDCAPALEGLNLLVVEDETDTRELLTTIFQGCKAEVREAASSREAMNLLGEWTPDVLISDIQMPGEDGYSLIRKVRERELSNGTRLPAVALTAHARVDDRVRALSAGFDAHISKPVEPDELIMVVASLANARKRNFGD